jgi:hypothetical protein
VIRQVRARQKAVLPAILVIVEDKQVSDFSEDFKAVSGSTRNDRPDCGILNALAPLISNPQRVREEKSRTKADAFQMSPALKEQT